jgi:hypothetical protein
LACACHGDCCPDACSICGQCVCDPGCPCDGFCQGCEDCFTCGDCGWCR